MPIIKDYQEKDGILTFDFQLDNSSTYEAHHIETLKRGENNHFWFSARRKKIAQTFDRFVDKDASILEIGGGTGFVAEKLIEKGFSVELADIHSNALHFAQERGIKKLYQFDLFYPPFLEEFDVICLFDVLEHLKEEERAFECLKKMLKPGGKIIFTVPAHQWLWSRDDILAGHARRYTKKTLEKTLAAGELTPLLLQYFFMGIVPMLYLRKCLRKDNGAPTNENERVDLSIHPLANHLFSLMTKLEFSLQKYLPNKIGGSLIGIAEKPIECIGKERA